MTEVVCCLPEPIWAHFIYEFLLIYLFIYLFMHLFILCFGVLTCLYIYVTKTYLTKAQKG